MDENTLENIIFGLNTELKELKAENEQLSEINDDFRQEVITLNIERLELQKQVDELKAENTELYKERTTLIAGSILQKQQAVKDTAKEILDKAIIIDKNTGNKGFICIEALTELCKNKGAEVE